jgi:proline iminopeptidase
MLHGGPGAAHDYPLSMKALADERPMIFYDQLGCGKADTPTGERCYTIQRSLDEVDPVHRALGLDRVIPYGRSWGTPDDRISLPRPRRRRREADPGRSHGERAAVRGRNAPPDRRHARRLPPPNSTRSGKPARLRRRTLPRLRSVFYDMFVLRTKPSGVALVSFAAMAKSIAYRVLN